MKAKQANTIMGVPEGSPIPAITERTVTAVWFNPQWFDLTIYLDAGKFAM